MNWQFKRGLDPDGPVTASLSRCGELDSLMLRKLNTIYERIFGTQESERYLGIPEDNPVIFAPQSQAESYYQVLAECVERLGITYDIRRHGGVVGLLRSFVPRENPKQLTLLHAHRLSAKSRKCFWISIVFREAIREGKRIVHEDAIRQAVIADLQFDPGNVLIRPENLRDKLVELLGPLDIDFREHASFSRKYFVLAENEQKLRDNLPQSFMQLMSEESDLIVRIRNKVVLLARDRSIRVTDATELAAIAFSMMECA